METPIIDFLEKYAAGDVLRCHMPGHKGRPVPGGAELPFALDITEIHGADSLFEADGIIAQSERNMSSLYGSAETVYSAGGSTLCIQAMLALMKQEGRVVCAVRNVHRAFLNAAALLGLEVRWIMPDFPEGILSGVLDLKKLEEELSRCSVPACVYVTSPDYTGRLADIAGISAICRKFGMPLLVDSAHGAHLAFFAEPLHPIQLGADLCCDSAHKMLPALTGAAMLHTSRAEYAGRLKQAMSLFGSTSPSYLTMASLDLCTRYISERIRSDISRDTEYISKLRTELSGRLIFAEGDPFHITVRAAQSGFSGTELARLLRERGVECEYADSDIVVLLMSPMNGEADYERLGKALAGAAGAAQKRKSAPETVTLELPVQVMSIREAAFAPSEEIDAEAAEGRI
ncbi:MAG: aminotransferase class I/II-fold pyridoxal phosphate-dependent enzyme, partial [Ruminococcus sp.]|nr:aminotransferase class I/II-fold pyridoxal phosphate-dependent enzyme [Ruminococcus sp.]